MKLVLLVLTCILFVACAHQPKITAIPSALEKKGVQVQKETRKSELARIDRDIRVLRAKDIRAVDEPQARPLPISITEESLYSELLRTYKANDIPGVRFYTIELSKRFPKSTLIDNSLLLMGKSLFRKGHLAKALPYFQEIIETYERSNKRAAALLYKGMAYRELNLFDFSRQAFLTIKKEYPGSPEFFQVDMELNLLRLKEKS